MTPDSYSAADYARDVLVYGGGVALAIIALFLFMKVMKASATRRVRGTSAVSMTFDDLERMRRTGLIYEEEYRRAKARIAERVVEESLPKVSQPAEIALERALEDLTEEPRPPADKPAAPEPTAATPPKQAPAPATPATPAAAPKPAPAQRPATLPPAAPKRAPAPAPLDLDKLRATGQIDEAEYQRLKAYFERKQAGKG